MVETSELQHEYEELQKLYITYVNKYEDYVNKLSIELKNCEACKENYSKISTFPTTYDGMRQIFCANHNWVYDLDVEVENTVDRAARIDYNFRKLIVEVFLGKTQFAEGWRDATDYERTPEMKDFFETR